MRGPGRRGVPSERGVLPCTPPSPAPRGPQPPPDIGWQQTCDGTRGPGPGADPACEQRAPITFPFPAHSLLAERSLPGRLSGKSESCEPSAVYNQRSICLKRAEGPHKLRVQITFGAAPPTPRPPHCHRRRGAPRRRISCNPVWHGVCLALVTSAWPWSVGASISAAARPPAPTQLHTVRSLAAGPLPEKEPTWAPRSSTWTQLGRGAAGAPGPTSRDGPEQGGGVGVGGALRPALGLRGICFVFLGLGFCVWSSFIHRSFTHHTIPS